MARVNSEAAGDAPAATDNPKARAAKLEKLGDYIAAREGAKLAQGIVLAKVTHPHADRRVWQGRYSGIRLEQGPPGCVWSDGSKE